MRKLLFKNLANLITVFGLILAVWLVIIALFAPERIWLIIVLAFLIGLTDLLDGKVARWLGITSFLGGALDRLRDKIFICPTLIIIFFYYFKETFPSFILASLAAGLVTIIIILEIILFTAWIFGVIKKLDVQANQNGKIKMTIEFGTVIIWLFCLALQKTWHIPIMEYAIWPICFLLISAIYYAVKSLDSHWQNYKKSPKV